MKKSFLHLAALASLALLAGCGGTTGSGSSLGAAAAVTPASATLFAAIDTNLGSDRWKQVDSLMDRFPGKAKLIDKFRKSIREGGGPDFDTEVRPTLGEEIDVVWLGGDKSFVALTKPKDEAKFRAAIQKGGDANGKTYFAKIEDWTIFSDEQATLADFQGRQQAGKLADDDLYKELMGELPDRNALANVYVNGPSLVHDLGQTLESLGADDLRAAAAQESAEDEGWRTDIVVKSKKDLALSSYEPAFLSDVPSGALLYLSFKGDGTSLAALRDNPQFKEFIPQIEQTLGIAISDLDKLLAGEGALYVRQGSPFPEVTLLLAAKDERESLATLDKLAQAAALLGAEAATEVDVGGVKAKRLSLGMVSIYYAALGDGRVVVTDMRSGIENLKGGGAKLKDDADFREAKKVSGLPDKAAGLLYVNMKAAIPVLENYAETMGDPVSPETDANLRALKSLVAYGSGDGDTGTATVFLQVK